MSEPNNPVNNPINSPVLNELIHSVRSVLAAERDTSKVARWTAAALRPFLGNPGLLTPEQQEPDPERYRSPPGDVHTVYNPGPETAISIHIYGADVRKLGSSIRFRYDLPIVETVPVSLRPRIAAAG